ncbi:MAG: hypothetical protein KAI24_26255 [Planctomycetes bacterium]|nr:hypothetical protein [Planctomycetota bacterium]
MISRDPPERLRKALTASAAGRNRRDALLAARDGVAAPGDVYSLPCHSWADLSWLVVEVLGDDNVRLAPGDTRPWANAGDLWVGEDSLCLRLASCVTLPASLLPAEQRTTVLPDAPGEVFEHERSMQFVKAPSRSEDADRRAWRALVARSARVLPTWLRDGVLELRLSEFREPGRLDAAGSPPRSRASVDADPSMPRMAADSSSAHAAFLAAMDELDGAMLVDELDCDCGGTLQLVATRSGLSLLFTSEDPDAVPPRVLASDVQQPSMAWQSGGVVQPRANRIRFVHDWRAGPVSLRLALRKELSLRVVDDVWFT